MPVDSTEYDVFDYEDTESRMPIDDAVKAVAKLAKANPGIMYRIVPADLEMDSFRLEPVHPSQLYAQFLSRYWARFSRFFYSNR